MHVTSSLVILATAVVAALTLRYLRLLAVGPHDRPRRRTPTVLLIVVVLCSTLVIAGADAAAGAAPAGFRTAIARNLGAVDETVTSKAPVTGGAAPYLEEPQAPFIPAQTADRLRNSLTSVAGVVGVIVQPAAFPHRAGPSRVPPRVSASAHGEP